MQPDTTNILSNLDKLQIIPVIQELLNRTEGINLQMPVIESETDFVPDLWQGYGDSDKERIFCQIKSRFSKENELSRIFAIYDQFEPKRLILVFLTKVTQQARKDFLSSIDGKIEVISIYDIDDLNDRLQDQTDLQEKLAEIATGSDEPPDENPLEDKEKIKREPEEIKKRIRGQRDRNFWWINANPGKWHIDQYEVNQIQTYSTHSSKGNPRKVFNNFFEAKEGDLAVGYQAGTDKKIKALFEITKPASDKKGDLFSFRLLYFLKEQTPYAELIKIDSFGKCEVIKYNNQGSLFRLTYEEFRDILNTTELNPVEIDGETDKIPFHLDNVEDTDRLNREPIARSVARLLNDQIFKDKKSLKHSFMIHIQGAWGDGKSTFLNLLDKHLKGVDDRGNGVKEKDSKWVIVNFNAWRHQHIDPPWWILMDTVYQSIQKSKGRKRGIWWRERWWRLVKLNSMYWVAFLVLLAIFLLLNFSLKFKGLNIVELINNPADGKMLLSVITSYISIIGSAWFLIKAISGSLIPGSSRAANEFKKNVRDPMDMLKRHFEKVINYTDKNVAVFIDDLDRCNADFTVGLLEGIQTLFSEQPVLYVVAGDRHWISACFENHYDDYKDVAKEPAQRLGYLFLEKAFQLSFRLPKVSGEVKQKYWDYILNPEETAAPKEEKLKKDQKTQVKNEILKNYSQDELIIPENMEKIMEDSQLDIEEVTDIVLEVMDSSHEDIHHLLRNHYHLIDANPRGIKRLANQYTVYRNILIAEGREFDRDKLFRWLILQNKYPIYVDWLETNLQDYTRGKDAPEELKELEEDDKWKQLLLDEKNENKGKLLPADISVFTGTGEEII